MGYRVRIFIVGTVIRTRLKREKRRTVQKFFSLSLFQLCAFGIAKNNRGISIFVFNRQAKNKKLHM